MTHRNAGPNLEPSAELPLPAALGGTMQERDRGASRLLPFALAGVALMAATGPGSDASVAAAPTGKAPIEVVPRVPQTCITPTRGVRTPALKPVGDHFPSSATIKKTFKKKRLPLVFAGSLSPIKIPGYDMPENASITDEINGYAIQVRKVNPVTRKTETTYRKIKPTTRLRPGCKVWGVRRVVVSDREEPQKPSVVPASETPPLEAPKIETITPITPTNPVVPTPETPPITLTDEQLLEKSAQDTLSRRTGLADFVNCSAGLIEGKGAALAEHCFNNENLVTFYETPDGKKLVVFERDPKIFTGDSRDSLSSAGVVTSILIPANGYQSDSALVGFNGNSASDLMTRYKEELASTFRNPVIKGKRFVMSGWPLDLDRNAPAQEREVNTGEVIGSFELEIAGNRQNAIAVKIPKNKNGRLCSVFYSGGNGYIQDIEGEGANRTAHTRMAGTLSAAHLLEDNKALRDGLEAALNTDLQGYDAVCWFVHPDENADPKLNFEEVPVVSAADLPAGSRRITNG